MSDGINVTIDGLSETQGMLDNLATKAADRAVRKALRAGARIEQSAIVDRAPVKVGTGGLLPEGALKSDVVITVGKSENGMTTAKVKFGRFTAHVARWVEYGHRLVIGGRSRVLKNGVTTGPGRQIGTVKPVRFVRDAYEATVYRVIDVISTTLKEEVTKASVKAAKQLSRIR